MAHSSLFAPVLFAMMVGFGPQVEATDDPDGHETA